MRVLDFELQNLRRDFCFQIKVSLEKFGFGISKLASSFENVMTLLPTNRWIFHLETNEKEDFERQVPKLFLSDLGKKKPRGVYAYEIFSTQAKC